MESQGEMQEAGAPGAPLGTKAHIRVNYGTVTGLGIWQSWHCLCSKLAHVKAFQTGYKLDIFKELKAIGIYIHFFSHYEKYFWH